MTINEHHATSTRYAQDPRELHIELSRQPEFHAVPRQVRDETASSISIRTRTSGYFTGVATPGICLSRQTILAWSPS